MGVSTVTLEKTVLRNITAIQKAKINDAILDFLIVLALLSHAMVCKKYCIFLCVCACPVKY